MLRQTKYVNKQQTSCSFLLIICEKIDPLQQTYLKFHTLSNTTIREREREQKSTHSTKQCFYLIDI